ncbi:hypothetical protein RUND412_008121 [Rhizina undulata]
MEDSFKMIIEGYGLPLDKASVLTTWKLSFQELNEDARKLLYICAFLSNIDIPKELFRRGKDAVDWVKHLHEEDRFDDTIGQLYAFSLAKPQESSEDSFYIHPLVQAWTREYIDSTMRFQNAEYSITLVASAIDKKHETSPDDWTFERRIISH